MVTEARSAPASSRTRKSARSAWWRVHQWAGLQLSLFISFVFVTGTLAVFSYEMDWMVRPAMWAAPTPVEERVSWGSVAQAVRTHAPEADIISINAPLHGAATFDVVVQDGDWLGHVYVHPRTGDVTGTGPWAGIQRFLRNAHRHLMLPVPIGVTIVSLAAVFLAVSLVTSFWVYKKWWRGFLRWPKGRTARALTGDIHRFAGLWSIWFVALMIVTSLWYLVEQWGGAAPAPKPSIRAEIETAADPVAATPYAALDRGIETLRTQIPDYRIARVIWAEGPDAVHQVHGYTDRAILVRPRANAVWVDGESGKVLDSVDPSTLSLHQRVTEAADPLHFGTFGGYLTKTLWFLFGVVLSGLSLTGVAIYALRIAKSEREAPAWRAGLVRGWRGMGSLRWLAAAAVALPFVLAPVVL